MTTLAQRFADLLTAIYDADDDEFKNFLVDIDGVPAGIITQPQDYNIGAIGSTLEWLRRLSLDLLDQIYVHLATTEYVTFALEDFLGIYRYAGETDVELIERVRILLFEHKMSVPAIIEHTRRFSSPGPPAILEGGAIMAYADVSFSDVYSSWQNQTPGPEFDYWIFPAIAASGSGTAYYFMLVLQNTGATDLVEAVDLVNKLIAAGVYYEILVET